jgi:hypothetical protein
MASVLSGRNVPEMIIACSASRWTVFVDGEVDRAASARLAWLVDHLVDLGAEHVTVDMRDAMAVDEDAKAELEVATEQLAARGVPMRLVSPSSPVTRAIGSVDPQRRK